MSLKALGQLFLMFLKVNLLSTSGPASVGLLYKEAVGNLLDEKDFIEAVGFSSVLPGSDALQLAMFVGYSAGGLPGVGAALLGSILPPTLLMLGLASLLKQFQGEAWLAGFVGGLAPAVAMLMVFVAWQVIRGEGESSRPIKKRALLIALLCLTGLVLGVSPPLVLVGGGLLGIVLYK
ncbi:MAG: hypothetical protein Kow002_05930 [Anaerolineales bacterium]